MRARLSAGPDENERFACALLALSRPPFPFARTHASNSLARLLPYVRACVNTDVRQARAVMAQLSVDTRERALMQHLDATRVVYRALTLPVGDVLCTYDEGGCAFFCWKENEQTTLQPRYKMDAGESRPPACLQPVIGCFSALRVIFDGSECTSRCSALWLMRISGARYVSELGTWRRRRASCCTS